MATGGTSVLGQTPKDLYTYWSRCLDHWKKDIHDLASFDPKVVKKEVGGPKKILLMMSDTGGGHRASALSLKAALEELHVPKHEDDKLDIRIVDALEDYTLWFSNRMYNWYTTYPVVWGTLYKHTKQTAGLPWPADTSKFLEPTVRPGFRRLMEAEKPDLVISVHPIMQAISLSNFMPKDWRKEGQKIPFLTCVTDLGEAHPWWFNPEVDELFVPTENMKKKAIEKGLKDEQVSVIGLPLREGFWNVEISVENTQAKRQILGLDKDRKVVLVMGGGDGMGKLKEIVLNLGEKLEEQEAKVHMIVVCGRNSTLQNKLMSHKWGPNTVMRPQHEEGRRLADENAESGSKVFLSVLGFVQNMEEWMVASDIIVTKAGPGTIAEAAVCGLPCMLYDFLPGQEEGNILFVQQQEMGAFEEAPLNAANVVCEWLSDAEKLETLSKNAKKASNAKAALLIARQVTKFLEVNDRSPEEQPQDGQQQSQDIEELSDPVPQP